MKRSVSRASKAPHDVQETKDSTLPGVPESKWREMLEKEETDMFILGIREEIVSDCMNVCYENYMQRQAVAFAVHCAYLAWEKVINVYNMPKDPGDEEDSSIQGSWIPDKEPEPSVIDSWGSQCIRVARKEPKKPVPSIRSEVVTEVDAVSIKASPTSLTFGETGEYYVPEQYSKSDYFLPVHEKSIFSRTLSMSKESLLLLEPVAMQDCPAAPSMQKKPKNK